MPCPFIKVGLGYIKSSAFSIQAGIIIDMAQESQESSRESNQESIQESDQESDQESCVFCDIVAGRIRAHRIWEDELTLCILDINPFSTGHSLVIPKRHVPWWHELSDEENSSLFKGAGIVARKMMAALRPDFVCMYARGRRIAHTHIFLVPTVKGDVLDRFFNALELFQESPAHLAGLREEKAMIDAADLIRQAETE